MCNELDEQLAVQSDQVVEQSLAINAQGLRRIKELNVCGKYIKVPIFHVASTQATQPQSNSISNHHVNNTLNSTNTCTVVSWVGVHKNVTQP